MFPSLKKDKILEAHKKLSARWKPMLDLQCDSKEVYLSIGRTRNKKMDAVGSKGTNLWRGYTVQQCLELAMLNVFLNDFFVTGSAGKQRVLPLVVC